MGVGLLLPERLLQFAVAGSRVVPRYLTATDQAWLRILIEEYQRFDGLRVEALRERLREPLPCDAPDGKRKVASHVLDRLCSGGRPASAVSPRRARRALFLEAQHQRDRCAGWSRDAVVSAAAASLDVVPEDLLDSLFADLPRERLLRLPSPPPAPHDLALRANLALAQGFLQRSASVRIEVHGNARALVRQVRLRRLLCTVPVPADAQHPVVEISGPYTLFRRTLLYGRALASLVSVLRECDRFRLTADVVLQGQSLRATLQTGDPIFPRSDLPARYDSRLEERFSLDFRRLAPHLDLVREPEPIRAGHELVFPDFEIFQRRDPTRRVLVEIVGFWTPEYLERKLRRLRQAHLSNLVLCIDEDLAGRDTDVSGFPHVVFFRRRIDPGAVLTRVEALLHRRASAR